MLCVKLHREQTQMGVREKEGDGDVGNALEYIRQSEGGSGNETGKEIRLPRGLHPYEPKCILSNSSGTCLQSSA